ncbi:MAG: hypothetical protein LBR62_00230 [Puniceicoccales bacterium]|nr:hypothetical protein [Puniceicoccales bacterium]
MFERREIYDSQFGQFIRLESDYRRYRNAGDIIKGEPNDTLEDQILQALGEVDRCFPIGGGSYNHSDAEIKAVKDNLEFLDHAINGEDGLQLKSRLLEKLEQLYINIGHQLYLTSYSDAHDRYNELKTLLGSGESLEKINSKFDAFVTLSNGGAVDGQRWTFAAGEKQKQASTNVLNSLVLAGNLAAERNRFALLESQQKSMEKSLNNPDENIQKGVFSTSAPPRSERFKKEMEQSQDLVQQQTLKTIEEARSENERIRQKESETRDDIPPHPSPHV